MRNLIICLLILPFFGMAQKVSLVEVIAVPKPVIREAIYFYANNWKVYRDSAVRSGIIVEYSMQESMPDSTGTIQLLLITVYKNEVNFRQSEQLFRGILSALRPQGPLLLNQVQPAEFGKAILRTVVTDLYSSKGIADAPDNPGHLEQP